MDEKSVVVLRIPKRVIVATVILIVIVAIAMASWQIYPLLQKPQPKDNSIVLQPINLTLVALNGTTVNLDELDISQLEPFESKGGFKTSTGRIGGIGNYTGVQLVVLCNLIGGITNACSLRVTAIDGYSMVLTYNQIMGQNLVVFNPATGDEPKNSTHAQLTTILAYYRDGQNLTSEDGGPLRLAILGPEGLLTDGAFWVKWVVKIEIRRAIEDWTLELKGALNESMTRGVFESGVNEKCHGLNWTDGDHNVWTGIPLWLLIGRIDDGNAHQTNSSLRAFNDTLAIQGYTVKILSTRLNVTTGQRIYREFNSLRVMRNANIIVANRLNDAPLPDPYWPLRLVGSVLSEDEMISSIEEIQIIFLGS